jgi:hypothetical protein
MLSSVDSCPPCKELVEVNNPAGLSIKLPCIQSALVSSKNCFIGAAILPNRVGLPTTKPAHPFRSSWVATIGVSADSEVGDANDGTVLTRA